MHIMHKVPPPTVGNNHGRLVLPKQLRRRLTPFVNSIDIYDLVSSRNRSSGIGFMFGLAAPRMVVIMNNIIIMLVVDPRLGKKTIFDFWDG